MRSELIVLLGEGLVDRLNLAAQIVVLLVSSVLFYEARSHELIRRALLALARLEQYFWFGPGYLGVGARPATIRSLNDFPRPVLILTTVAILSLAMYAGRDLLFWATYPLLQFSNAFTVWSTLSWNWQSLLVPVESILYFVWGLVAMVLIYPGGFGIPMKTFLSLAKWVAERLSHSAFHFVLFALLLVSGGIIIAASTDILQ